MKTPIQIYFKIRFLIVTFAIAFLLAQAASTSGTIIPANRCINWSLDTVGVPGDIPHRTVIFTNLPAGSTPAAISAAINACPSNQVVQLAAGTYVISSRINITRSGVTLRGAGSGAKGTVLLCGAEPFYVGIDIGWSTPVNISSGYTKGSSNLVVSSISGFAVGQLVNVNQLDDTSLVYSTSGSSSSRFLRTTHHLEAINGTTLTIWPPLPWTLSSSLSPQIQYITGGQLNFFGLESLSISNGTATPTVFTEWNQTYGCWMYDVKSSLAANYHHLIYNSCRFTERKCFMNNALSHGPNHGGNIVGVTPTYTYGACFSLFEDNISVGNFPGFEFNYGASGNVIAYNLVIDSYQDGFGNGASIDLNHGPHNLMNLVEGNYCGTIQSDGYYGSSSYGTIFRNCAIGWGPTYTSANAQCIELNRWSLYWNVVGNLLGTNGIQKQYQLTQSGATGPGIYMLGYPNMGNSSYTGTRPPNVPCTYCNDQSYDLNVGSTVIRHGNYDTVSNSIIWDPTISDHTLPNSCYLSAKPVWFGNLNWPPFNPASPATANPTNIPAGYRYVFEKDPPAGTANLPPIAVASASPTSGVAPLTVTFSSAGSYDPEGAALTYKWTFGDGTNSSTVANPSHIYQNHGTYTAQLTVSDGVNSTVSSNLTIRVGNQPPIAIAGANPTYGARPLTVAFSSAGSYDPEGATLSYAWTFGNGATSIAANPSYTYQTDGVFTAQLTVSDGVNKTSSSNLTITVSDVPPGLVAAYGFEEGSGTNVFDTSGNTNNGTISHAIWTTGKFGKALSFAGTNNSLVTVNDSASLHMTSAITVEAWVYPTAFNGNFQPIIIKPMNSAFSSISFALQGASRTTEVPSFGLSVLSNNISGSVILPLNAWSHLAATYDGTTARLYINGTPVASQAQTGTLTTATQPLSIGMNWGGRIDEVRIYNRALSAGEIQTNMNTSVITVPAPPSWLRFGRP